MPGRRRLIARRSPDEKLQPQQQQLHEVDECVEIMETTIMDHHSPANSNFFAWPMRLASTAFYWLTLELGSLLEGKIDAGAVADDPVRFLPSVVSFILGLILVKNYGDSLDSMITATLGNWGRAVQAFFEALGGLTCNDFENVVTLCVVVLFWIGAFRIVGNVLRNLREVPKHISCEEIGGCKQRPSRADPQL